jgi:hypothetical protein
MISEKLQYLLRKPEPTSIGSASPYLLALIAATCATHVSYVLLSLFTGRYLFGDCAWFVLKLFSEGHLSYWHTDLFKDVFVGRIGAVAYQQGPALLLSKLGVRDLGLLSVVYGATLYFWRFFSIATCWRFTRDKRLMIFPLMSIVAGSMNVDAYLISESHVLASLFWPLLFFFVPKNSWTCRNAVLLIVLSLPTVLCYESMALFGIILAAAVAVWTPDNLPASRVRIVRFVFSGWYLLGTLFACLSVLFPRDAANRGGFLLGLRSTLGGEHLPAVCSLIVLGLVFLILLTSPRLHHLRNAVTGVGCLLAFLPVAYLVAFPTRTNLDIHVQARGLNFIVPLLVTAAFVLYRSLDVLGAASAFGRIVLLTTALGISQASWHLIATDQWSTMLAYLKSDLRAHDGPIPFAESSLSRASLGRDPIRNLHADWPVLPLSVLMSDSGAVKSMVLPPPGAFTPFDPTDPRALPDLATYGISYAPYITALNQTLLYKVGSKITFGVNGNSSRFLRTGWSHPEEWGTWSVGETSSLVLRLAEPVTGDLELEADVGAFVSEKNPRMTVLVNCNSTVIGEWSFVYGKTNNLADTRNLRLPRTLITQEKPNSIEFRIQNARSPYQLGLGGDPRLLGIRLICLKLKLAACQR